MWEVKDADSQGEMINNTNDEDDDEEMEMMR